MSVFGFIQHDESSSHIQSKTVYFLTCECETQMFKPHKRLRLLGFKPFTECEMLNKLKQLVARNVFLAAQRRGTEGSYLGKVRRKQRGFECGSSLVLLYLLTYLLTSSSVSHVIPAFLKSFTAFQACITQSRLWRG